MPTSKRDPRPFILSISGAVLFAAFVPTARADDDRPPAFDMSGVYLELRGGALFLDDAESDIGATIDFDTGYLVSGAIGYSFDNIERFGPGFWNNVSIEIEGFYGENENDEIANFIGLSGSLDEQTTATGGMVNVYYESETGTDWRPYVGVGIGVANVELEARLNGLSIVDDDDTVFAYQARAGVRYELTPNTRISVGYRFFETADPEFNLSGGGSFETEYQSHTVEVGLRYKF